MTNLKQFSSFTVQEIYEMWSESRRLHPHDKNDPNPNFMAALGHFAELSRGGKSGDQGNIELDIMAIKANLYCKRTELAILRGNTEATKKHRAKMFDVLRAMHDARMAIAEQDGECFFVACGEADRAAMGVMPCKP